MTRGTALAVSVLLAGCAASKDGLDSGPGMGPTDVASTTATDASDIDLPTSTDTGSDWTATGTGATAETETTTGTGTGTTTATEPEPVSIESVATLRPPVGLARQLSVLLSAPAPLDITCTTDASPEDVLVLHSEVQTEHLVDVLGLLPDTTWACTIDAPGDRTEAELTTDPLPDDFPVLLVTAPGIPSGAWTLIHYWSHRDASKTTRAFVVDTEGRVRWWRDHDGSVDAGVEIEWLGDALLIGGGGGVSTGHPPTLLSLTGETLFSFPELGETGGMWHHDAIRLPDGAILGVAESPAIAPSGDDYVGLRLEARDPATGELTWVWDSAPYVDAGLFPARDVHANAVQYVEDEEGPALWVSAKLIDAVFRIDWETGDVGWQLGVDGDFTLLDAEGRELGEADWFYGQHALEREGDRLLLYDNGLRSPAADPVSRALELELDIPARTATIVWEWTEPYWQEPNWGDADRLPGGHVLVGIGHCWSCDDAGEGRSRVVELDADGGEVWRMTFDGNKDALYRADRYDGCEMFRNRRYCDSL